MKGICIFGASSDKIDNKYKEAAYEAGKYLAQSGYTLVFGAGGHGIMGAAARGAHEEGGEIFGVIPEKLNRPGIPSPYCTELCVTPTMHTRKETMEKSSVGFIAFAGGFGTFEELLEIITLKQLGYLDLPIVILNTDGYYDDLIRMFEKCVNESFADRKYLGLFYVCESPKEAVDYIISYKPVNMPDKISELLKEK